MNVKTLKRLFSYLNGSSAIAVLSVFIGIFYGAATVAIPYFAGKAIDNLSDDNSCAYYFSRASSVCADKDE